MTSTAFDDQFTAEPEHITHRPYDTAAILRQNVADLEKELQRQRERAEKAEAELMERCYRMLLSEPDVKGALFKAENILRESLADRGRA